MSKNKDKKEKEPELTGPWRSIHGAIWLIGLALLFWKGWWWPGILVLLAVSGIAEALIRQYVPDAVETVKQPTLAESSIIPTTPFVEHQVELLPTTCPNCGGPIRGHEVKWTGPHSADCPYCGANLPVRKN